MIIIVEDRWLIVTETLWLLLKTCGFVLNSFCQFFNKYFMDTHHVPGGMLATRI